jgi:hypothetical protein
MNSRAFLVSLIGCALVSLLSSATAHANFVTWHLQNVSFNDGGTASGFFTLNSARLIVTDVDITTTPGTTFRSGITIPTSFHYTPETVGYMTLSSTGSAAYSVLDLVVPPPGPSSPSQRGLFLFADSSLLDQDTRTTALTILASTEVDFLNDTRQGISGSLTSTVPEPRVLVFLVVGIVILMRRGLSSNVRRHFATAEIASATASACVVGSA